ncbi:hypothetical protein CCACVL1_15559 [Corchorus capsularis]|uniref:Uncharacterized protein n=1 Tax=Corchorus capsularis TaxID=210143 RepID=A0A1R3I1T1_COCAP|nr:hypothetical protein CCACVL1_15559 [Corchorus capsularis]
MESPPYFRVGFTRYSDPIDSRNRKNKNDCRVFWSERPNACHSICFNDAAGTEIDVKVMVTREPPYFEDWEREIDNMGGNSKYLGPIGVRIGRVRADDEKTVAKVLILCAGGKCLLCNMDDMHEGQRNFLHNLLRKRKNTFYGSSNIFEDVQNLKEVCGITVPNVKNVAELDDSKDLSYEKLVEKYLNYANPYFPPNYGWANVYFDNLLIAYGAFDAYCCYALGLRIEEKARLVKEIELQKEAEAKRANSSKGKEKAWTSRTTRYSNLGKAKTMWVPKSGGNK